MTVRFRPRLSASQRCETGAAAVSRAIRIAEVARGLLSGQGLADDLEDAQVGAAQEEAGDVGERRRQGRAIERGRILTSAANR